MDDEDEDKFASEMYDDKWPMSKNEANIQQDQALARNICG